MIRTMDSIRNNYLLNTFISLEKHFMIIGPTGTGKTINIVNEFNNLYFNDKFTNLITAFSG